MYVFTSILQHNVQANNRIHVHYYQSFLPNFPALPPTPHYLNPLPSTHDSQNDFFTCKSDHSSPLLFKKWVNI